MTLEDVLEELIQTEIVDETDQYQQNTLETKVRRGKDERQEQQDREAFFRAMVSKGGRSTTLTDEEVDAITSFFILRLQEFEETITEPEPSDADPQIPLSHDRVRNLLLRSELLEVDPQSLPTEAVRTLCRCIGVTLRISVKNRLVSYILD